MIISGAEIDDFADFRQNQPGKISDTSTIRSLKIACITDSPGDVLNCFYFSPGVYYSF
jgi:hypothetical protein